MYTIGIDLGTSAVKLVLMRGDGTIENTVSKEYPLYFPHAGWAEQDPADWWNAVCRCLPELLRDADSSQVQGISFGGQMHGLVILDAEDRVIRPAILWNDGRTGEETDYLNNEIGRERLSSYTANIAFAGFTAPKLLWLRKNEPDNFSRIRKIMLPKDYIAYRLCGVHCTDYSDASGTLLLDVENRRWSEEMTDICGIRREMLPRLFESYETVGFIKPALAARFGLPADCRIAAGAGDNAAAAVGTGTVGEGKCNISLGTSGTIFISGSGFRAVPGNTLHSFAHADGHYHLMGCILSAAACNRWWMDDILGTADYEREQALVTALGDNHVFFLPYLMGERSPHNDPNARGTFTGITMDSTRADMTQAVLEGVAFAIRDSLEAARSAGLVVERTRICGGGAKSRLWKKIIANVLNLPVDSIAAEEGPGLGAAMLAAVACGQYASVSEAAEKITRVADTISPDPVLAEKYERQYRKFRKIYPALRHVFAEIAD